MSDTNARSGGIGFCGLLTIVFIVLRLTNVIDWEWWWVLAPLWVPTVGAILLVIFVAIFEAIAEGPDD